LKKYRITSTLNITRGNIGISGASGTLINITIFPSPNRSVIYIDSPTLDGIYARGTSPGNQIAANRFNDFNVDRTQAPGSDAAGLRLVHSSAAIVQNVIAQDHTAGFYLDDVGSLGYGYIDNSAAAWGYQGFTETSGSFGGFVVNSLDGAASPSLRIRNSFVVSNPPQSASVTTYGLQDIGLAINDLHVYHLETALVSYGVYLHATGGSFGQSSDTFLENIINDACLVTCVYMQGIRGTVNLMDSWNYEQVNALNSYDIDIEDSTGVGLIGNKLYYPGTGHAGIYTSGGGSLHIVDNWIYGSGPAISLNTTSGSVVNGNVMNGPNNWGTNIVELKANSQGNVVSGNSMQGTATNGLFIDPSSASVAGIDSNQIGSLTLLGTITNYINDTAQAGAGTPESLIVGNARIPGSGGVQFPIMATGATACLHMDPTGNVTAAAGDCNVAGTATTSSYCGVATFSASTISGALSCSWVTAGSHCTASWVNGAVTGGALGFTAGSGTVTLTSENNNSNSASVFCSVQ
jgi:hypothetical protein